MICVDASVLVTALADDGPDGDRSRERLRGQALVAPHLVDIETASAWRRLVRAGYLDDRRADLALADLRDLPLDRVAHGPLVERCWQLRDSLSVYDAAYVALAELLGVVLLTLDVRLSRATGPRCGIEVLA